jgi:hypothetical protein
MLDLVIPDSGPLITLGSIDRLDEQIHKAGRNLARDPYERRARVSSGDSADWKTDYDTSDEVGSGPPI